MFTHTDVPLLQGSIYSTRPFLRSLRVERLPDPDADASWLEQECWMETEHAEAYRRGEFGFLGIRAVAEVAYSCGESCLRLETFTSAGMWGIEDNSSEEYLRLVEAEELEELRSHLLTFGVVLASWDELLP